MALQVVSEEGEGPLEIVPRKTPISQLLSAVGRETGVRVYYQDWSTHYFFSSYYSSLKVGRGEEIGVTVKVTDPEDESYLVEEDYSQLIDICVGRVASSSSVSGNGGGMEKGGESLQQLPEDHLYLHQKASPSIARYSPRTPKGYPSTPGTPASVGGRKRGGEIGKSPLGYGRAPYSPHTPGQNGGWFGAGWEGKEEEPEEEWMSFPVALTLEKGVYSGRVVLEREGEYEAVVRFNGCVVQSVPAKVMVGGFEWGNLFGGFGEKGLGGRGY